MGVRKNIKLIFDYYKLNITKAAQYRVSFVLNILMMIANNAFFIVQWVILFSIIPNIGGYGFKEVMMLWAVCSGSFGIAHMFFHGAYSLTDSIYSGKLDVYLTQPKNVLLSASCSNTSVSAIGDLIYSFIVLIFIGASFTTFLAIIPFLICSALIQVSTFVIYSSLSFYIRRGDAVANSVEETILAIGNYPPNIFNTVVKGLSFSLIPASFIIFVPATLLMTFNIWLLLAYIAFTCLVVFLAFLTFQHGLKKYNSGSLMGGRL